MTKMNNLILKHTYHHDQFADKKKLLKLKEKKGLKISLAFPTLNEENTIGKEILIIKTELMERYPLLDEIVVIDSNSVDFTREIAADYGAKVFKADDILPQYGNKRGKGENLWKSLYVLEGDIIVWIDADIQNIHPKFVYGLLGPLLENDELSYVKAFYERPITGADGVIRPSGGGRVTEILVRPIFSLLYPELTNLVQPLSGEYAGRREILEQLSFSVGYGVEIGHLLDIYHKFGINVIGQVDLDKRIHRNQSIYSLSKMGFAILKTFLSRAKMYNELDILKPLLNEHIAIKVKNGKHSLEFTEISSFERPPMISIKEYKEKFKK